MLLMLLIYISRDYTLQVLNHSIRNLFVLCAFGNEQAEYNLGDEAKGDEVWISGFAAQVTFEILK
jgi:hypothetical protein